MYIYIYTHICHLQTSDVRLADTVLYCDDSLPAMLLTVQPVVCCSMDTAVCFFGSLNKEIEIITLGKC